MGDRKHRAFCGTGVIEGERVILVKPQTFMNVSGESVGAFVRFYKLNPMDQLIVVYDDISLPLGKIRVRRKGSAGGHNGMKSIISHVGTQDFVRIKVGVGEKPEGYDLADFVLSRFSKAERRLVEGAYEDAVAAVPLILHHNIEQAMNHYN
jgi:PTH1 family peptidyl-tRNA hydrolase